MKERQGQTVRKSANRLEHHARARADKEARRIPWQRLFAARNQYMDWQEFYLWVRSILEVEDRIPDWLVTIFNERVPGFLESEKQLTPRAAKGRPLPLRLEDWIDNYVFGSAKQEGWFNGIAFYAVREPRYQRAEVCWSECVHKWKKVKPDRYPTFDEWKKMAAQCDPTAHLVPRERAAQACLRRVDPDRLSEAVSRYIDLEAVAYWVRPALDRGPLPAEVTQELNRRCPGFLSDSKKRHGSKRGSEPFQQLMHWIADHFFLEEEKKEGWLDAVLLQARMHPRSIRTMEFSDHCRHLWDRVLPCPYPAFDQWRRDADAYVERDSLEKPGTAKSFGQ
jgi:hypothetical protein